MQFLRKGVCPYLAFEFRGPEGRAVTVSDMVPVIPRVGRTPNADTPDALFPKVQKIAADFQAVIELDEDVGISEDKS
jgi:hypothetical protein